MRQVELTVANFNQGSVYSEIDFNQIDFDLHKHQMCLWGWIDFLCDDNDDDKTACYQTLIWLYGEDAVWEKLDYMPVEEQLEVFSLLQRLMKIRKQEQSNEQW